MTLHRTCPQLFAMSARQVRRILAPMLSTVRGLEYRQRIGFRVVENSRGDFVFGTMLSWDAPCNPSGGSGGFHTGIDDTDAADRMLSAFLEMVLDRLRDGVLVHEGIGEMLNFLRRHGSVAESRALLRYIERALDMGMVFDALLPTTPLTLEAMGERIAGIPRSVQGDRLSARAIDIQAPAALVRLVESCGGPHAAWAHVLKMVPSAWADEWIVDESPVWGELLVEDGELRMARLRELDRWLMEEVLSTAGGPTN